MMRTFSYCRVRHSSVNKKVSKTSGGYFSVFFSLAPGSYFYMALKSLIIKSPAYAKGVKPLDFGPSFLLPSGFPPGCLGSSAPA